MKRDLEHLDLKRAFRPVPEACHRALMDAARSVREEQPVKRISYRAGHGGGLCRRKARLD